MPIEVIEENRSVAQIRITCNSCGGYIGTRIVLKADLEGCKEGSVCPECKKGAKIRL